VGRGDPRRDLSDHVLSRVTGELRETLVEATAKAADAAELFLAAPIEEVMKRFNAAPKSEAEAKADAASDGPTAERGSE
jgi:peptidyl-tRNA hydrolase